MPDLGSIFKAYDVRGLVPSQLDDDVAYAIGMAFAAEVTPRESTDGGRAASSAHGRGKSRPAETHAVVVGHDMRETSAPLARAFTDGVRDHGTAVVLIGLASTDELYFGSGSMQLPAAMVTASHNPAGWNGIKLCRAGAVAMSSATGLSAVREGAGTVLAGGRRRSGERGPLEERDLLGSYSAYLNDLVPVAGRHLSVVVDAGNGMAGLTVPAVLGSHDVTLVPLYFELDGAFPNHEANPLDPANLRDLQAAVVDARADVGLAFDGDADRCFVVDEEGRLVSPSALAALIAVRTLSAEPGATIVHNLITGRVVPEVVARHGGTPVRTPVGHSLIKAAMAEHRAAFGAEHSGHFYFRDFWFADSGLLAALHLLAAMARSGCKISDLVADYVPYASSGEVNLSVADVGTVLGRLAAEYGDRPGVRLDHLDGLTVMTDRWWFNVRPSNTEPMLRLNVEAETADTVQAVRDEVLGLVARRAPNTP